MTTDIGPGADIVYRRLASNFYYSPIRGPQPSPGPPREKKFTAAGFWHIITL